LNQGFLAASCPIGEPKGPVRMRSNGAGDRRGCANGNVHRGLARRGDSGRGDAASRAAALAAFEPPFRQTHATDQLVFHAVLRRTRRWDGRHSLRTRGGCAFPRAIFLFA
jgi:hypothetical protein